MIEKVIRYFVAVILIIVFLLGSIVGADSREASEDERKLAETIEGFFRDWLIKGDIGATMKYVSPNAILCKKSLPEELIHKENLSKEDILSLFEICFSNALQTTKKSKSLADSISSSYSSVSKSSSTISIQHSQSALFELFVLNISEKKTAQNFAFICKFDETPAFREAVGKPTCYYMMTDIHLTPEEDTEAQSIDKFPFEMVWIKEGSEWRILTLGVIED